MSLSRIRWFRIILCFMGYAASGLKPSDWGSPKKI